jgi:hypothetical protein
MFVRTSPQRGLFETDALLSEKSQALLKRSWAEGFAREVLPILLRLEPLLAPLYSDIGRPNWSAARMLGLVLLRELHGLRSDLATVEALAFDARFQHALGVALSEAYLSKRSLVDFRCRLAKHDPDNAFLREVFEHVTQSAIEGLGLSTSKQRLDSTFIRSNIAILGRTALLSEALERLLDALSVEQRERLEEGIRSWYADQDGWESRLDFERAARWLYRVIREFRNDEDVASSEPYQLAKRLFQQHVRMTRRVEVNEEGDPDDDPPPASRKRRDEKEAAGAHSKDNAQPTRADDGQRPKGERVEPDFEQADKMHDVEPDTEPGVDRMQSLHDRDARLGQKGTGYLVQLAETCGNEDSSEIITGVSVAPANAADVSALPEFVEALEGAERKPNTLLSDAAYTSADNLEHCAARGVELLGPVRRLPVVRELDRNDFTYDERGQVVSCPEGRAPIDHRVMKTSGHTEPQPHAIFDRTTCNACPKRIQCPVVNHSDKPITRLSIHNGIRRRDRRLKEQRTAEFRQAYALRSGIEATNSELKRSHALGRLTIRGLQKVHTRVLLKVTACNIKRWHATTAHRTAA